VRAAQPARRGVNCGHQIGDRLCASLAEFLLLVWRERLQIACHLPVIGCDDDQALVLRPPLEPEQALYRDSIIRVAAKAIAGFGGIGDQSAAPQVRRDAAIGCGVSKQFISGYSRLRDNLYRGASGARQNEFLRRADRRDVAPSSRCRPVQWHIARVRHW